MAAAPTLPESARCKRALLILVPLLLLAFALRVTYLTQDRFHADEALYAGWALRILDGDPFLLEVPVDKPPLYLHTLAASMRAFGRSELAARLPNLAASMLGIALVYRLGKRLYGRRAGLWAALWLCLSPFDILFARTAFTDPMLVLWVLAACNAAVTGRWMWVGVAMGIGFATKQHAVVLIPLPLLLGWAAHHQPTLRAGLLPSRRSEHPPMRAALPSAVPHREAHVSTPQSLSRYLAATVPLPEGMKNLREGAQSLLDAVVGFAVPFFLVIWWDSARWAVRPGFWRQSALSYGGLAWADPARWGARLVEWGSWARYLVGSPLLYILLLVGTVVLLLGDWGLLRSARNDRGSPDRPSWFARRRLRFARNDRILTGCAVAYTGLHTILQFSVWDRYLLPLAPLVALLLARIVERGMAWLSRLGVSPTLPEGRKSLREGERFPLSSLRVLCVSVVVLAALFSGAKAALNGYPVGGEHWAYQGLDRVVAYLVEHAAPDAVLYHHWLRWHYTYYLHGTDFELRWWQSSDHLYREAARTPDREQYVVLPDWATLDPSSEGIVLEPVYETRRWDGSVSFRVYRIHC